MRVQPGQAHGDHDRPGRLFWPAVAAGWVVMGVGAWGLVSEAEKTRPTESIRFVVGAAVLHDLVLAPVVVLAGWALARAVPARARGPVQVALMVSAVVALFSIPFVRGYGKVAPNPSILPRNYGAGLAVILSVIWAVTAAVGAGRWWTARRAPPATGPRVGSKTSPGPVLPPEDAVR